MSRNKEALIRYRIINNCLLNGKIKSKEEIMNLIHDSLGKEVSERTFADDIRAMREDHELGYLAPILFDKIAKGYYYTDPAYSIDNIPLSEEEIEALSFAATLLDQYKRIGIFGKFTGAVGKIVDLVKIRRRMESDQLDQFVEFESAPLIKGSEFIEPIILYIKNKKVLEIEYQSFNSKAPKKHTIHPYYLKEYRNRWYITGFDEEKQSILTLGLERIVSLGEINHLFFTSKTFDAKEYFKHSFGISVNNQQTTPIELHISYSPQQALYFKTQPLHESQEILVDNENECIMRYSLCPNYELKSYLLGLGTGCKIIQPESLKNEIIQLAEGIIANYQTN